MKRHFRRGVSCIKGSHKGCMGKMGLECVALAAFDSDNASEDQGFMTYAARAWSSEEFSNLGLPHNLKPQTLVVDRSEPKKHVRLCFRSRQGTAAHITAV